MGRSSRKTVKELFLMRHGMTSENAANILIGQNDPPLNEEAIEEILSLREYVAQPDIVFSSDLRRASETARLLFPAHEIVLLPELRERDGGAFQGKPVSELREASLRRMVLSEMGGDEDTFERAGVEPLSSLTARAERFLRTVRDIEAQSIMAVSHGGFINCLVNALLPKEQIGRPLGNLHYHKIVFDDQGKAVEGIFHQQWR